MFAAKLKNNISFEKVMQFSWYDLIGSIGVSIIIVTYFLLQTERIKSENIYYSILNACGSSLIILSLIFNFNLAALIQEAFWVLISIYGVAKCVLKK
jgi:hypothetical protein